MIHLLHTFTQLNAGQIPDRLGRSPKFLHSLAALIVRVLTMGNICNKSLSTGTFPDRLKYSEVKPLPKKGDKLNASNYRPISILTSISKVLEETVHIQLSEHSNKYNILADEQFGFRNK